MSNMIVELRDVKVSFTARRSIFKKEIVKAVDGVSLQLSEAEILALVGESGCGKSTLARVSLRLLQPSDGKVFFDGRDITSIREEELTWFRREAQIVFQDPFSSLDPFMTVYQIVAEPLEIHGLGDRDERRMMVLKALSDVGLTPAEDFLMKYPHMLSGGQRQRVGVARALVLRPRYLVVDEPVSMIDASSRAGILYLLDDLRRRYRVALLYITHDMATAKHFSDKMAVMYLGRIVEEGPTIDVIENPLHPYTQALLQAIPEPDPSNRFRARPTIPGEPPSAVRIPSGCRFHPRCSRVIRGRCEIDDPPLEEIERNRKVACVLY